MIEPYKPHQRAIVFKNDAVSGATLGHYCTIVRVHDSSIRQYPFRPHWWKYRVFVPFFSTHMDVAAADLFVTGDVDSMELPPEPQLAQPLCELRFNSPLAEDNPTIEGAFRLPSHEWEHFSFRKCDQQAAGYRLSLPVKGDRLGARTLCYDVPRTECLNREFVLLALAEIVGVTEWRSH